MTRLGAAKKRARQRLRPVILQEPEWPSGRYVVRPTPESFVGGLALVQEKRDARARRLVGQFLGTVAIGLVTFAVVAAMLGVGQ